MALKNLFGWSLKTEAKASSACGSACGAGDKPAEPSSACGAADPKPTACGAG
ncbi:ACGX-repeat peptide [Oscillibacter valericigenes]|uniref:ACGX-repeat peptide n=1 Tax=Oscillibacter valericigenes TaxID=351091 RepID=UPI00195872F9|nr:ACGX-repeat peptide [Oscillibacter valericigenes]MBM6909835.1 ACGX-repeat peptide [Oscillibacter valericigenes]